MGLVSVVTSGKGGAGKSTVTAGLGCALAKLGHRVLVVDTDAGLRSLDLMLGGGGSTVYDMADIFAGNCEPIRAIYPSPVCPNVFVVPAPVSFEKLCTPQDMKRLCRGFARYRKIFGEVCDTPVEPKRLSMFRIRRDSDVVGIFKRKNAFPAFQ